MNNAEKFPLDVISIATPIAFAFILLTVLICIRINRTEKADNTETYKVLDKREIIEKGHTQFILVSEEKIMYIDICNYNKVKIGDNITSSYWQTSSYKPEIKINQKVEAEKEK